MSPIRGEVWTRWGKSTTILKPYSSFITLNKTIHYQKTINDWKWAYKNSNFCHLVSTFQKSVSNICAFQFVLDFHSVWYSLAFCVVSFQTINVCRNKMYLSCSLKSISLEITRETKVVHFVDSLFVDYNFCIIILNGSSDKDHVTYF